MPDFIFRKSASVDKFFVAETRTLVVVLLGALLAPYMQLGRASENRDSSADASGANADPITSNSLSPVSFSAAEFWSTFEQLLEKTSGYIFPSDFEKAYQTPRFRLQNHNSSRGSAWYLEVHKDWYFGVYIRGSQAEAPTESTKRYSSPYKFEIEWLDGIGGGMTSCISPAQAKNDLLLRGWEMQKPLPVRPQADFFSTNYLRMRRGAESLMLSLFYREQSSLGLNSRHIQDLNTSCVYEIQIVNDPH